MKQAKGASSTGKFFKGALLAVFLLVDSASAAAFAKYDGIDGESKDANHDKWIDVLRIDWGIHKPGGGATGQSRRRGDVVVEDVTLTIEYEKASPKLQEACLKGEVIPSLKIDQTLPLSTKLSYLNYEFKNVLVTRADVKTSSSDTDVSSDGSKDDRTILKLDNLFEEVKVSYTKYDDRGKSEGATEFNYKVERGKRL